MERLSHRRMMAATDPVGTAHRLAEVEEALKDALEFAAEGWAYADTYFIEKWGAKEEMARLQAVLTGSATDSTGGSDG